jgi:mono/diheme cytochrome c family protein
MFVRVLFFVAALATTLPAAAEATIDFEQQIQPIFAEHCIKCHGEKRAQAKLRLDNAAGIEAKLAGDPELLVAGKPEESELYERLVLPADSKKRMPKGAEPLAQSQIDLIAEWIKQGAVLSNADATAELSAEAKPVEKLKKSALPEVAPASQSAIDRLTAAGARVNPLFAGSNLLEVSFANRGEPAGDVDIALVADVADQVYALNLVDARVTAAGLAPLAQLKNLARLHLERSNVDDEGVAPIAQLEQLEYLNLYGTAITDDGLAELAKLKNLGRLYLWQTKVSYDAAMSLEQEIPGLLVNLGFDHPEVARRRLTKELELAKKQAEEAAAEVTQVKSRLEQLKKNVESTAARVTELEQQLKSLQSPTDGT